MNDAYQPRISDTARDYHARMMPGYVSTFAETDPEFVERFDNFAFDEVISTIDLPDRTRFLAILATLLGSQASDEFRVMLGAALELGVTPVEAKEIVYQGCAYLGIGRVFPFLSITNEVLTARGVELPLPPQATTEPTYESRVAAGEQTQVDIFGDRMRGFATSGPADAPHINAWLAANCFGDWYTRTGLDLAEREMITFCVIAAQGGCEPQLTSHAAANLRMGNDKDFLVKIVSQCLPFIGYPRSLNALTCVRNAAAAQEQDQG